MCGLRPTRWSNCFCLGMTSTSSWSQAGNQQPVSRAVELNDVREADKTDRENKQTVKDFHGKILHFKLF